MNTNLEQTNLVGGCSRKFITNVFDIFVDETQSVEDLVRLGNFAYGNESITSKIFPKPENGQKSQREVVLFCFNKTMFSRCVIEEINKAGRRLANVWETISLVIKEPELYKEFPIFALGSSPFINEGHSVVCVRKSIDGQGIFLYSLGDVWNRYSHFVSV